MKRILVMGITLLSVSVPSFAGGGKPRAPKAWKTSYIAPAGDARPASPIERALTCAERREIYEKQLAQIRQEYTAEVHGVQLVKPQPTSEQLQTSEDFALALKEKAQARGEKRLQRKAAPKTHAPIEETLKALNGYFLAHPTLQKVDARILHLIREALIVAQQENTLSKTMQLLVQQFPPSLNQSAFTSIKVAIKAIVAELVHCQKIQQKDAARKLIETRMAAYVAKQAPATAESPAIVGDDAVEVEVVPQPKAGLLGLGFFGL